MATDDAGGNALVSWYANNVARPSTSDEAYGYWAYVIGAVLGVVGLGLFLLSTSADGSTFWTYRALSFSLVAIGLATILYGFVIVLPLGDRATRVALLGLAISFAAVVGFLLVYPGSWNVRSGADYSGPIVALYALGLAVQVVATVFFPSGTAGTRPESGSEVSATAASTPDPATDAPATDGPASKATFERYRDRAGAYRWRLVHDNGNIVADGGQGFTTEAGVEASYRRVQRLAPDADTLEVDPAAFEIYQDRAGEYRWRLVHRNGNVLADSGEGYGSRSGARDGIESVRANVEGGAEVYEDGAGEYRWRLVHENGNLLADSGEGYVSEAGARQGFERVAEYAPSVDSLTFDPAGFEVYQDRGGEWRWRLVHRNGQVLADSGEGYASKQKARQGLDSVRTNAAGAAAVAVDE